MRQRERLGGPVTYANGEQQEFTDPQEYLRTIQEELPYRNTTGFRHETLTDDPSVREAWMIFSGTSSVKKIRGAPIEK